VLPITEEYIARAGMQGRILTQPGDLLTSEFGSGYDLVLLFSVTHLLGEQENRSLLARCCRALRPGGRVAIHDHILDEDKTKPRAGAIFALNMLVATRNGGTYSFTEYSLWLRDAGFSAVERRELEGAPTGIVIGVR
jgi:SAM-dependent methyltransferase